jgi:hypothetical protein
MHMHVGVPYNGVRARRALTGKSEEPMSHPFWLGTMAVFLAALLGAPVTGYPISFAVGSRQYVAASVGGGLGTGAMARR